MTRTTPEQAPLSKLPRHTNGRTFGHCVWFSVQLVPYTADLQWNRVSSLEPSGSKAETFPQGYRGPDLIAERNMLIFSKNFIVTVHIRQI
ncbi:hypothetical protein AVEN_17281-1 [Araneus ventricosus]|uniref:Uncharacterized protein n=1 Tax=Araneus ventricosus TaxID=182803 RepID=A0A4Y2VJ30_ARAVE|nr:hypothetical protein AVEN_17281-1 [Araneus ventricosus]